MLELVHLFLTQPRWEEPAMERAKQMYLSHYRSLPKSLERATADRIMAAMMGPDRWGADVVDSPFASNWSMKMHIVQNQNLCEGTLDVVLHHRRCRSQ